MTREEIMSRKAEIKTLLESDEDVDLEEIKRELDELDIQLKSLEENVEEVEVIENQEEKVEETTTDDKAEERRKIAEAINNKSLNEVKHLEEKKEEIKMEKRDVLASVEYRNAWAKTMMGLSKDKFTEDEVRALGDALTTTATTFVEADADTQGINNAGLLVPTTIREELMENIYQVSPFLRDVRKLAVAGNIDLPYIHEADDANWYAEGTNTTNEGIEFKALQLTGWDLAKDVEITWKAEEMTVKSFIAFIIDELTMKMGRALANAVLYGNGSNKPTGALNGLVAQTDADPFQAIKKAKATLSSTAKIGAKAYISEDVEDAIVFAQDKNNAYPYLAGLPRIAHLVVEVDPFLQNSDILVGNPMNYVLNEVRGISIEKERNVKGRKVVYGAYGVFDGKAKPNSFAKGQVASASI